MKLLGGQKKSAPFWTFEYYQAFFDIETHHVRLLFFITVTVCIIGQNASKQLQLEFDYNCTYLLHVLGKGEDHWIDVAVAWEELYSSLST